MTLRCKVGQSAYIVRPATMNIGRVVQILRPSLPMDGYAAWVVGVRGEPLAGISRSRKEPGSGMEVSVRDDCLLPITGLPTEEETKQTEEA